MSQIAHLRCLNHPLREAAALCLECKQYFCRECVTEHEGKVLCASCLSIFSEKSETNPFSFDGIIRMGQFFSGTLVLWVFFYYLGQILLSIPSSFHEGEIWTKSWW